MLPIRDRIPTRTTPYVNYAIIALNVLVYAWEAAVASVGGPIEAFVRDWGLVPLRFVEDPIHYAPTVFTSMFVHDPAGLPLHLGGNMLFLWIFGDNVEDALGHLNYAVFYLLCGMAAAFAQVVIDPSSRIPMIGASGAISGALAAYGSLYPRSPITVLNPIPFLWFVFGLFVQLPAWVIIIEYFVVNLMNGLSSIGGHTGGVAFFAHLGGFVAGLILCRFFMSGRKANDHDRWQGWRPPPRGPQAPSNRWGIGQDKSDFPPRPRGGTRGGPWDF